MSEAPHPGGAWALRPWSWALRGWAVCQLATWLPRGWHLPDNYSVAGVVVERGAYPLPRLVVFSEATAWAVWGVGMAALVGLCIRPRISVLSRVLVLVALVTLWSLHFHEGMNFKAYDRLLFWQGVVLLLGLGTSTGRSAMFLVYCGIYGSTGWHKVLLEPTWWQGEPLRWFLYDNQFALRPLGMLVSHQGWLLQLLAWGTLAFECFFPLVVWIRPARPALLLLGTAMHLGIFGTMYVNTFSFVAMAMYPLLLDAEQARALHGWILRGRVPVALLVAAMVLSMVAPPLAARWWGPRQGVPFRLPDRALRAELRADLDQLVAGWPRDGVALAVERWGLAGPPARLERGAGPCFVAHALTEEAHGPRDNAAAIAAVLALSTRRSGTFQVYGDPGEVTCPAPIVLDSLGGLRHGRGTQTWPSPWGWLLPWEGDFYGVTWALGGEERRFLDALRAVTPVPLAPWPAPSPHPLGRGVTVTDTGAWRGADPLARVDDDSLTLLVEGLAALPTPP